MLYYKYYNDKSEYNKLFKEAIIIRMSQDIQVKQKCLDILGYRNIILLKIQSLFYFEKLNYKIKEIPIILNSRTYEKSKMKLKHIFLSFVDLFILKIKNIIYPNIN